METPSKKDREKVYRDRYRQSDKYKATCAAYSERDKARRQARRGTVEGHLHSLYSNMTTRCGSNEFYTSVENKFISPEHLIWYVVEVLKVDPRGLECHRMDNDKHYEEGNIEFLTRKEHVKVHVEMRKNG